MTLMFVAICTFTQRKFIYFPKKCFTPNKQKLPSLEFRVLSLGCEYNHPTPQHTDWDEVPRNKNTLHIPRGTFQSGRSVSFAFRCQWCHQLPLPVNGNK